MNFAPVEEVMVDEQVKVTSALVDDPRKEKREDSFPQISRSFSATPNILYTTPLRFPFGAFSIVTTPPICSTRGICFAETETRRTAGLQKLLRAHRIALQRGGHRCRRRPQWLRQEQHQRRHHVGAR